MIDTKQCSRCKEVKPSTEFYKSKKNKDGLSFYCKSCDELRAKRYREANKKEIAEYNKQYREANKEKIAERRKQYRKANKEKIAEYNKQYYEANKEKIFEYKRRYAKEKKF